MDELTVGHYSYHKVDGSDRWFRKQKDFDGQIESVRTGKRVSTANNEIVRLTRENDELRAELTYAIDEMICPMCRIINPQHKECRQCAETDSMRAALKPDTEEAKT